MSYAMLDRTPTMYTIGARLHTAARRYCIDRIRHWHERYAELGRLSGTRDARTGAYTKAALDIFPRYNVLSAILVELESLSPDDWGVPSAVRDLLALAGDVAEDEFTRRPIGAVDADAILDERRHYREFILTIDRTALDAVEPLPYRRVLQAQELAELRRMLQTRWQVEPGYWYPLIDIRIDGVVAFDAEAFTQARGPQTIHDALSSREIDRVLELNEFGPSYQKALVAVDLRYSGAETFWTSTSNDWVVYASHERSITVGGWMLESVKAAWTQWQSGLWSWPNYKTSPQE